MKKTSSLLALVICLMLLMVYLPTFVSADDGKLDLSATLILRPNADGGYQSWTPKNGGSHYVEVDDITSDGSATELHQFNMFDATIETWNIQDPSVSGLTITSVTIHEIVSTASSGRQVELVYWATDEIGVMNSPVKTITAIYPSNWEEITWTPNRVKPWTWDVITSLQIGIVSANTGGQGWRYITQAWLEVNYVSVGLSSETPSNESSGVSVDLTTVSVDISGQTFNWTIGGNHITTNSAIDDTTGTKTADVNGPLAYATEYAWWVNASVGTHYTNMSYTFTTEDVSFSLSNENPLNGDSGYSIYLPTVSVDLTTNVLTNWTIGGENITTTSATDDTTGTKTANISGPLAYDTEYTWWVNASVGKSYVNNTYSFTTENAPPTNLIANGDVDISYVARILARGTDGTLYSVYSQYAGGNIMLASSTDNGTTWTSIPLSNNVIPNTYSYDATIATGTDGSIYVAWSEEYSADTSTYQIQCRFYQDGSWGDVLNVTELRSDVQTSSPAIAITSDDVVYFVWQQYDFTLGLDVIVSSTWDNDTGFWGLVNLTDGTYDAQSPSITISNDEWNTAYATWGYEVYDAGNDTYEYGIEYTCTGEGWNTPPIRITAEEEGCYYDSPRIVIDLDGVAYLSCFKYNMSSEIYQIINISILYTVHGESEIICTVESIDSTSISIDSNNAVYIVFSGEIDNSGITDNISGAVHLARGYTKGIYNAVNESSYTHYSSPENTEWSDILGSPVEDPTELSYTDWETAVDSSPPDMVGNVIYMHIISEDRYFEMHFSYWQQEGGGGFSYTRYEIVDGDRVSNVTFTRLTDRGIYYCSYNGTWSTPQLLISGNVYSANLMFALYPHNSPAPNIPDSGGELVYCDNDDNILYYKFAGESAPPPSYPAWDINQDGVVNYLDVSSLVSHYGQSGAPGWIPEDINDDSFVNYLDVSSLVSHYGESY